MWLGFGFSGGAAHFINKYYKDYAQASGHKTGMIRVSGVQWFTNLPVKKRHEDIILYKEYSESEYPKYDNYDAIEIGKTKEIPLDYTGVMGVPITFLEKYNPGQFEIIGLTKKDLSGIISSSKSSSAFVNGEEKYCRIFIRNRKVVNTKER